MAMVLGLMLPFQRDDRRQAVGDRLANRFDAPGFEQLGNAAGNDRRRGGRTRGDEEPSTIPAEGHSRRPGCLDAGARRVDQPGEQRNADCGTEHRWQRRTDGLAGSMPCGERADQAENRDSDDADELVTCGEETNDQRGDAENHDDPDAQRQLVVGAEPIDRQGLQPRWDAIDELAADGIDGGDDIDDAGNKHAYRDGYRSCGKPGQCGEEARCCRRPRSGTRRFC